MPDRQVWSVSQVNLFIKNLLDETPQLSGLLVRGELSNYKVYPSGHHYFTLKDSEGAIRCVMFRGAASKLRFRPENGMQVIVSGRVGVYPRDGAYQFYCTSLSADGIGDLYVAFEQLKEKLSREGLFDPAHKRPLPAYPQRIAIVTSGAGAAVHDMIRILRRRYPIAKVLLLPVRVQGVEAPPEIVGAIRYANRWKLADVLITGRGGGSIEDLWAFNDERVARAIYNSEIPVISAVGHEPDVTIADFVADRRASTPSNAAEIAVPDMARAAVGRDAHDAGGAEPARQAERAAGRAAEKACADRTARVCAGPADAARFCAAAARRRRTEPSRARGAALCAKRRGARRDESTEGAQPRIRDGAGGGRQRSAQRAAGTDRRPD